MNLKNLLGAEGIDVDKQRVLALWHTPKEPKLRRALPRLAAEEPDVFNAFQSTQGATVERDLKRANYIASFIGQESGNALFVGVYEVGETRALTADQFWRIPAFVDMRNKYDMQGFNPEEDGRSSLLWFDLALTSHCAPWKGKLIVKWPTPDIRWFRWVDRTEIAVFAILRESELVPPMPTWDKLVLSWEELSDLPRSWEEALRQWRAIYYIFDISDSKGYVGSACGEHNLLGRWRNYRDSGHGDNRLLRDRAPENFRFTILQTTSLGMQKDEINRLENNWKQRLHTRAPFGLNSN